MQLFYLPNLVESTFEFSEEESKHCIRVLRKKKGDKITLIDGKGTEAIGLIISDNPKKCSGEIIQRILHEPNRNYHLHIAIAPTKNFERIEWMLEKCIEIGIDEISFIETSNSERSKINLERCEKIAISAIKQSKQFYLPRLHPIQSFQSFLVQTKTIKNKWIAWCESEKTDYLSKQITSIENSQNLVCIGPEGDFTTQEIQLARAHNFAPCSLGTNILRSETAAVLVAALMAAKYNS
ncbi:MAG: RsmE family RNA methyltransferase [Bacteroidia bacterium]|jgi:16S rRNA (uracil1498-N3)-methyltransferase